MSSDAHDAGLDLARQVIHECLAGRVRMVARVVTARYDAELAEVGLTANQVTILAVIAMLESTTATDMQPFLLMDASTISRNVARMVEHGWIAATPAEDRRSQVLTLASPGFQRLAEARPAWERAHAWAEEVFGARGGEAIRDLAHRVNPLIPE